MNKKIVDILVLLTLWVSAASAASASNRIALVIGNSDYRESALRNPINDAKDISAKLREFDFDVTELTNINKRQFTQAVREFHIRLLGSDKIGMFFYAGHAVEIDGRNYLIPLAADIQAENDVEYEAVDASRILSGMERAGNGLNLVVLDACRNNPFRGFFRSAKRGIRTMSAPKGSLIMYSAQPGEVADDGRGRNGLFTKHLLTHLDTQGADVFTVFQQTARAVHRETNGRQLPYIEGVLLSDFYFRQAIEERATKKQSPEVILAERADTDQRVTTSLPKQESSVASAIEQTPPAIKQTIPAAKPADSTAVKNQATPAPSIQISHIGSTVEQKSPISEQTTTPTKPAASAVVKNQAAPGPSIQISHIGSTVEDISSVSEQTTTVVKPAATAVVKNQAVPGPSIQISHIGSTVETVDPEKLASASSLDSALPGLWQARSTSRRKLTCNPILNFTTGPAGDWDLVSSVEASSFICSKIAASKIRLATDSKGAMRSRSGRSFVCISNPLSKKYCSHVVYDANSDELLLMFNHQLVGRAIRTQK